MTCLVIIFIVRLHSSSDCQKITETNKNVLSDVLGMTPVPVAIQKDWAEFKGSLDDFLELIVKSDGESKFFYYDTITRDVFVQQYGFVSNDEMVVSDSDLNKGVDGWFLCSI